MKKFLSFFLLTTFFYSAKGQNYPYCISGLYSEFQYYTPFALQHYYDIVYGVAPDTSGNMQNLTMDLHFPHLNVDPMPARPLIILIHGGELQFGDKNDMSVYAKNLAASGYVAANINYRLGWRVINNCNYDVESWYMAIYRCMQDIHSATRYLVHHANDYRIDTNQIFIVANSEASLCAMQLMYASEQQNNTLTNNVNNLLGGLYTSGNNFIEHFTVKGMVNWCGAVLDTTIFDIGDTAPLLSLHGMKDSVMPLELGTYNYCPQYGFPLLYGPMSIYHTMKNIGLCTEANYDANGEHCNFPSLEPVTYIPAKFTCFIKNLLCGNCKTESKISYNQYTCIDSAPLSTKELEDEIKIILYPNPAEDILHIKNDNLKQDVFSIKVFNIIGNCIFTKAYNDSQNNKTIKIPTSEIGAAGVYFLQLQQGNKTQKNIFVVK